MKKLIIGFLALVTSQAFAGQKFNQVISYKEQFGKFTDLRIRFEPTKSTNLNPLCKPGQDINVRTTSSGTSDYYNLSFTSPNNIFCKYNPIALMGTFQCFKESNCSKDIYPVSILFSMKGGVSYSSLPNDNTGFEKVISFPKNDPYTLVQASLSDDLINEREAFQFVIKPE